MISLAFNFSHAVFELESAGECGDYLGNRMGRFELIPGEEREGSPVYGQARSGKIPRLLYR